jgi:hypothetical protein
MAVAPDRISVNIWPAGEIVDGSPHVENVLPGKTLPIDQVAQEGKSLEVLAAQNRILPLLETHCVGAQDHVSLSGECDASEMHWVPNEARWFALANVEPSSMLMPDRKAWSRRVSGHAVWNEQVGGNTFARLNLIGHFLNAVPVSHH